MEQKYREKKDATSDHYVVVCAKLRIAKELICQHRR